MQLISGRIASFAEPLNDVIKNRGQEDAEERHAEHAAEDGHPQRPPHLGAGALGVVFVFLVLAAQYESWSLPLAVILVVPMCLLFAIAGVTMASMEVNIFTQIGFVVLVGLASKNAILIVEFAKQQQEQGRPRREATLEASRLRLRPILMTSFAFIFGVIPLVVAQGAGSEMRRALGLAVFAGMIGVTLFGIFLTPVFFYVIRAVSDRWAGRSSAGEETAGSQEN